MAPGPEGIPSQRSCIKQCNCSPRTTESVQGALRETTCSVWTGCKKELPGLRLLPQPSPPPRPVPVGDNFPEPHSRVCKAKGGRWLTWSLYPPAFSALPRRGELVLRPHTVSPSQPTPSSMAEPGFLCPLPKPHQWGSHQVALTLVG